MSNLLLNADWKVLRGPTAGLRDWSKGSSEAEALVMENVTTSDSGENTGSSAVNQIKLCAAVLKTKSEVKS